jgi:hypothetical protein
MSARTINSEQLGQEEVRFGDQSEELTVYDGLTTPISSDVIVLTDKHARQIADYVELSSREFGDDSAEKEPTRAQNEYGVPSLVVRVDASVVDGNIVAYEMEDSPSGQGITDRIQCAMAGKGIRDTLIDHYGNLVGEIPRVIISGARSHGTDDSIIVGDSRYVFDKDFSAKPQNGQPVIIKAIPGVRTSHDPYVQFQRDAVAPLLTEGDKSYLERSGSLAVVTSENDLLYNEEGELMSQVLKSRLGSMAMGVSLFLTNNDKRVYTGAGTVTASRLKKTIQMYNEDKGGALVQPFVPPVLFDNPEGRSRAILRVFALLGNDKPQVIGGCYVARPGMIVHGATDAVSGAVLYDGGRI